MFLKFVRPFFLFVFCCFLIGGCNGEIDPAEYAVFESADRSLAIETCVPGEIGACGETLEQANGVLSCFKGERLCIAKDTWGPCGDGAISFMVDPTFNEANASLTGTAWAGPAEWQKKAQALSSAAACVDNPCDPSCQYFAEDPVDIPNTTTTTTTPGDSSPADPLEDWSTLPSTLTCAHQLCDVDTVALDADCHPCVETVCSQPGKEYCCTGSAVDSWDQGCVESVFEFCSASPPPQFPPYCNFSALADDTVKVGYGSRWPGDIGARNGFNLSTNVSAKDLISHADYRISNASDFENIYTFGNLSSDTSITTGNLYALGNINADQINVNGTLLAGGNITANKVKGTAGTMWAGGNITITGNYTYAGDIHAGGWLKLQSYTSRVANDIYLGGNLLFVGNNSRVLGNANIGGNISCPGGSGIAGNAEVGGSLVNNAGSCAFPSISYGATAPDLIAPTIVPFPSAEKTLPSVLALKRDTAAVCAAAGSASNKGGGDVMYPGIYRDVSVPWNSEVTFAEPGSYVLRNFSNASSTKIKFLGSGPWDITVCNAWHLGNAGRMVDASNVQIDGRLVTIYSAKTSGRGILSDNATWLSGTLIAPQSEIYIGNGTVPQVTMWGKRIHTDAYIDFGDPDSCSSTFNATGNISCGSVPLYNDSAAYSSGDEVTFGGKRFVCRPGQSANCSAGGWTNYWPLIGTNQDVAWEEFDDCPEPVIPGGIDINGTCPVTIEPSSVLDFDRQCESGLDCQVNSSCTEVQTDATCGASKCVSGPAKSNAGCRQNDACVDAICSVDPSCCASSGSWAQSCVDMVPSYCEAECGSAMPSICSHNGCSIGPALDRSCSANVEQVCDTFDSDCCDGASPTAWDQDCIEALTLEVTGAPLRESLSDKDTLCGYALVTGSGQTQLNGANVYGNVGSQGAIKGSGTLAGSAYSMATIPHSNVSGVEEENLTQLPVLPSDWASNVPLDTCPIGSTSKNMWWFGNPNSFKNIVVKGSPSKPQSAGVSKFNNLTVETGKKLAFPNGGTSTFYVRSNFTLKTNAQMILPTDGSLVNIYICNGNFTLQTGAKIIGSSGSSKQQLRLWSRKGSITFNNNSKARGIFTMNGVGGAAQFRLWGNGNVQGMVHNLAGTSSISTNAVIDSRTIGRDSCISRGADPDLLPTNYCPTGDAPATAGSAVESGTCVYNVDGSDNLTQRELADCSGVDLTLDGPCDYGVPVCNRGHVDLPANQAQIVFFDRQTKQFATMSPDPFWQESDICDVSVAIAAGTCETVTCPSFTSDMTAMVQMNTSATVSECNEMDNWTYYPEARACGGSSDPTTTTVLSDKVVTEVYEAVCPDDSVPAWGLLGWQTALEGAASVEFRARVSETISFSESLALLGTAEIAESTEDCTLKGCAVDVTSVLDPMAAGISPPNFLELEMTIKPSGESTSTLEDWQLTYSCLLDQ